MKRFDAEDINDANIIEHHDVQVPSNPVQPFTLSDRGLPLWASYLAFFFALGCGVCILAISLSLHVFQSVVAEQKDKLAVAPLLFVSIVPVLGLVVLDYAQSRALSGLQGVRRQAILNAQAAVAVFLTVALACIHPALALPALICFTVGAIGIWAAARFGQSERLWDFTTSEAVSILTGRDQHGFDLAKIEVGKVSALSAISKLPTPLAFVLSAALSSWLVAKDVLLFSAVGVVVGLSTWIVYASIQWLNSRAQVFDKGRHIQVAVAPLDQNIKEECSPNSVVVHALSATASTGVRLLSDVSFHIEAGQFLGIRGDISSGKSTLLKAIMDPFALENVSVQGHVMVQDQNLWSRSTQDQSILAAMVDHTNRILPASGRDNLTAFQGEHYWERARRSLASVVYSDHAVRRIMTSPDASKLSLSDQRALEFARMFFLAPQLYLLDRPESSATPALMKAFADRLQAEKKAGRSAIIVSEDRNLLAMCDRVAVLQNGRIIDHGPTQEIQDRAQSGWQRFVCDRQLESEDILDAWVRSQFRRDGDDLNTNNACVIAAELLAFSCSDTSTLDGEQLKFDFKHFDGYAAFRLTDGGTLLSSGQIKQAQNDQTGLKSPLSRILHSSSHFEQSLLNDKRIVSVHIKTIDPRRRKLKVNIAQQSEGKI